MVSKKKKNKICWLEDNIQDVQKWIWALTIHFFHHMTILLTLKVVLKKEFIRISIGKAYDSKNSLQEEEILDIGHSVSVCIFSLNHQILIFL